MTGRRIARATSLLVSVAALALVSGALTGTAGALNYKDDDWAQVYAIDCISSTQCSALGVPYTYSRGGSPVPASPDRTLAATFNPNDPDDKLRGSSIASSDEFDNLVCASITRCTVFDVTGTRPDFDTVGISFNPRSAARVKRFPFGSGGFGGASCPTSSQCTVDLASPSGGMAVTFDAESGTVSERWEFPPFCRPDPHPWDPACPSSERLGPIDCPSATQCTALAPQRVVTFNPRTGEAREAGTEVFEDESYGGLQPLRLDCVSTTQCTVLGRMNFNPHSGVVTFDPTTGAMKSDGIRPIAGTGDGPGAMACPSARQCVTTVSGGAEITFDPITGSGEKHDLVGKDFPGRLTCASESMCLTAVDIYSRGDQVSSDIVAFDPDSGKIRSRTRILLDATVEEAEANRRAALRKCRTIKDRSRRAACVRAAEKRWG